MENDIWIAVAAQLPLVAGFFWALQRGWLYVGRTFDKVNTDASQRLIDERISFAEQIKNLRADYEDRLDALEKIAAQERQDRRDADVRTVAMAESLREATEVLRRSVELHEQSALGAKSVPRSRRTTERQ